LVDRRVGARARRVEVAADAGIDGGLKHGCGRSNGHHAGELVPLDESHAAHVGGEHVDLVDVAEEFAAGEVVAEVPQLVVVGAGCDVAPLGERLDVDGSDVVALVDEAGHHGAADHPAGASDEGSGHGVGG
jgi:hypothetical protein